MGAGQSVQLGWEHAAGYRGCSACTAHGIYSYVSIQLTTHGYGGREGGSEAAQMALNMLLGFPFFIKIKNQKKSGIKVTVPPHPPEV